MWGGGNEIAWYLKEKTWCGLLYGCWMLAENAIDAKYRLHTGRLRERERERDILDETRGLDMLGLYPILQIRTAVLEQRPGRTTKRCGVRNIH
jgi:hypothetical protein